MILSWPLELYKTLVELGMWTGSEGRLAFPYQRVGTINALQELSNAPEGKYLTNLSPTICAFLLSCYKDDGKFLNVCALKCHFFLPYFACLLHFFFTKFSVTAYICDGVIDLHLIEWFPGNEEVKLASLSALGYWAARSGDAIRPDLISLIASGLKEKETLRRGHLRCLGVVCKKADVIVRVGRLI